MHHHNEKIYACFVDFKKPFYSVLHDGILFKLLRINVGGWLFFKNSTCSINQNKNQTRLLLCLRGVRQGCILSPLLFNLSDPFVLPNGATLNTLLYADCLLVLSRSKIGLSSYCSTWMLSINPKKPNKVMIFQKRAKKCIESNFDTDDGPVEIV